MTVYEGQYSLLEKIPESVKAWGWQDEICPNTGKPHRQGYLQTFRQVRRSALTKLFPGIHFEVSRDWNKLLNYCRKDESKDPTGSRVHKENLNLPMSMADSLTALGKYAEPNAVDYKVDYWSCVNKYLRDTNNAQSIGLFTNAQMLSAWTHTRQYWILRSQNIVDNTNVEINADIDSVIDDLSVETENLIVHT